MILIENLKRWSNVFLFISIILGILTIGVFIRLHGVFTIPDDTELMISLGIRKWVFSFATICFISITIALKVVITAIVEEAWDLKFRIKDLEKRIEQNEDKLRV